MTDPRRERLRALPSVDRLATAVARAELDARRRELLAADAAAEEEDADLVARAVSRLTPGAGRVLNATGIVIHTNLGRAPLAPEARAAVAAAAIGYGALEVDLLTGERSRRGRRAEALLVALTGAQDALVVNNGAAAVLLAVAALAGPGGRVIVSRGELVEIGGGLRIADVVAQSGAQLVEVGSTNRTAAEDYGAVIGPGATVIGPGATVIGPGATVILRVHQSNFRMEGYVARPALRALVALGVPVIDDLGSGALDPERPVLRAEPGARSSVAAGAALTCFSGDKLLGGPQAGIVVGAEGAVGACRAHPLARALRIDKLCLAGLEATLELHLDPAGAGRVPVLEMLELAPEVLMARTGELARLTGGTLTEMPAAAGGGALPLLELPGPAVSLEPGPEGAGALAARLRRGDPPLIARVYDDRVLLSARTLAEDEIPLAARCVASARRC